MTRLTAKMPERQISLKNDTIIQRKFYVMWCLQKWKHKETRKWCL